MDTAETVMDDFYLPTSLWVVGKAMLKHDVTLMFNNLRMEQNKPIGENKGNPSALDLTGILTMGGILTIRRQMEPYRKKLEAYKMNCNAEKTENAADDNATTMGVPCQWWLYHKQIRRLPRAPRLAKLFKKNWTDQKKI